MIDYGLVLSSALGVVLANFLMVLVAALVVAYEFRQYRKAIEAQTLAVQEHTNVYAQHIATVLEQVREKEMLKSPVTPLGGGRNGNGPKGMA